MVPAEGHTMSWDQYTNHLQLHVTHQASKPGYVLGYIDVINVYWYYECPTTWINMMMNKIPFKWLNSENLDPDQNHQPFLPHPMKQTSRHGGPHLPQILSHVEQKPGESDRWGAWKKPVNSRYAINSSYSNTPFICISIYISIYNIYIYISI